jgi:hypothetical protein
VLAVVPPEPVIHALQRRDKGEERSNGCNLSDGWGGPVLGTS